MKIETKKTQLIKSLITENAQAEQAVLNVSAVKETSQHVSESKGNKELTPHVSIHKAIQALTVFNHDRQGFMAWHDKMINALFRVHR